jgi:ribosomal protein S18 acetylase RimI-like enzyme
MDDHSPEDLPVTNAAGASRGIEGVEQVVLSVTTTMTAAARLYQSLGFRSFGCEPKAIQLGEKYADAEYMVLELSALL